MADSGGFRQLILQALRDTLSNDTDVRKGAEEKLKCLQIMQGKYTWKDWLMNLIEINLI